MTPISYFSDERALLAYGMNGKTLQRARGAPARAVVPGYYGFKQVKWVQSIEGTSPIAQGFWEQHGWTASAPHLNARIDIARREGEQVVLAGFAFAGAAGIGAVEVQGDQGAWQNATLTIPALSSFAWVQWKIVLPLPQGASTFTARGIDAGVCWLLSSSATNHLFNCTHYLFFRPDEERSSHRGSGV